MLTEIKDVFDKINRDRFVIGYDLSEKYVQVSYCRIDSDTPETISSSAEKKEEFNIPFVLLKKEDGNQWLIGEEAIEAHENGEGPLVRNVLSKAVKEENIFVDALEYRASDLLALFLRKSLAYLSVMATPDKIAQIVIAVREADSEMIRTLNNAVKMIKVNPEKVHFINYEESIFFYILNQSSEFQKHNILICDSSEEALRVYRLERNYFVNPAVGAVERRDYEELDLTEASSLTADEKDKRFLEIMTEFCESTVYSGVFLIGEGFYGDWCKESLRLLLSGRKVFKGNNLYTKGAAFAAKEQVNPSGYEKNIRYLGKDRLKANVGVEYSEGEQKNTIPLANIGEHWYETNSHCELILKGTDVVSFRLEFANKRSSSIADFHLEGLPVRPNRLARISVDLKMLSENVMNIMIKDMGFGEIYPSTGLEWTEEMDLG